MSQHSAAWNEGYNAYGSGGLDNPYTPGTDPYNDWLDGWWAALEAATHNYVDEM